MAKIVFDIETVGGDFEDLDPDTQEYFLKFAKTEDEEKDAKNSLSFYPLTAEIVAIGMLEVETNKGAVYFQNGSQMKDKTAEGDISYIPGTEEEILNHFWAQLKRYDQFITFNGRVFDGPFVMLRSAIHKIRAGKNLVPYRYNYNTHIDLADQLTSYDALRRRFSLHMWCKAFGITSPKAEGISGLDVRGLYKDAKYMDIARYCMRDIQATKELYHYWDKYLRF
jgi:hypothetical protein